MHLPGENIAEWLFVNGKNNDTNVEFLGPGTSHLTEGPLSYPENKGSELNSFYTLVCRHCFYNQSNFLLKKFTRNIYKIYKTDKK